MDGLPKINEESYIGDGVYIRFDGFQLWLRTNRFGNDEAIALEPIAFQKLIEWLDEYDKLRQYMYGVNDDRISGK